MLCGDGVGGGGTITHDDAGHEELMRAVERAESEWTSGRVDKRLLAPRAAVVVAGEQFVPCVSRVGRSGGPETRRLAVSVVD